MMLEALKSKRILVTGGTGFIGTRVVERLMLEGECQVRVLVRKFQRAIRIARFDAVEMVPGTMTDLAAVRRAAEGCDIIINCAHDFTLTFPKKNRRDNLLAAKNIAQAALEVNARLIHLSTVDTFGHPQGEVIDETTPRNPKGGAYAEAKWAVERHLTARCAQDGLRLTVLLPMIVYGPHAAWVHSPCAQLRNGRLALPNEGKGTCNTVYIDDLISAMFLAATNEEVVGETFIISGPDTTTWAGFFGRYDRALGTNALTLMTEEEFAAALRRAKQKRKLLPVMLGLVKDGTVFRLVNRMRKAALIEGLLKGSIKFFGEWLFLVPGCAHWDETAKRIVRKLRYGKPPAAPAGDPRPLILPSNAWLADIYRCPPRLSIEKARRLLGYEPQFDFERGIELTLKYIEWANL